MPSVDILYRLRKQRPDVFDKVEGPAHTFVFTFQLFTTTCPQYTSTAESAEERVRCVTSLDAVLDAALPVQMSSSAFASALEPSD